MKVWTSIAIVVASAVGMGATTERPLRWVRGLDGLRVAGPALREPTDLESGCGGSGGRAQTVRAELASAAGLEEVSATYEGGIVVRDTEGHELFRQAGLECSGSIDEIDVLAVGWIGRDPTIVLAATSGGRRESVTTVYLYRPGFARHLDPVFAAVVETRTDERIDSGSVSLDRTGLVYRPPGGGPHRYRYDPVGRTYVTTVVPEH